MSTCNHNSKRQTIDFLTQLNKIDVEDLQYVERDLNFAEKVSLAFLLYGENHANAAYALQKLLALAGVRFSNSTACAMSSGNLLENSNLLRQYANSNPLHWRAYFIEALVIVNARRVLRKLGFRWSELRQHYLPHISALSLHIHPMLKVLYAMCESMTIAETGRLVISINDKYKRSNEEHFRFYDSVYLEIFLLDWINRHIIKLGDFNAKHCDVQALIEYFKFNEMNSMSSLLINAINSNAGRVVNESLQPPALIPTVNVAETLPVDQPLLNAKLAERTQQNNNDGDINTAFNNSTLSDYSSHDDSATTNTSEPRTSCCSNEILEPFDSYNVSRARAGILLIINQQKFHRNVNEDDRDQLSERPLTVRAGTCVDKERLSNVFKKFGYIIEERDDLNHIEICFEVREVVKRSDTFDSLIVSILSHGIDGAVYGCDSIPVKISDIEHIISSAETLKGKPKMLIIQSCQTNDTKKKTETVSNANMQLSPEAYADMLKAMSTVPGYESIRHTTKGTWFIQALCDSIERYGNSKHMLDILTTVTSHVSKQRGNKNQVMIPLTHTTLRKPFFLPR